MPDHGDSRDLPDLAAAPDVWPVPTDYDTGMRETGTLDDPAEPHPLYEAPVEAADQMPVEAVDQAPDDGCQDQENLPVLSGKYAELRDRLVGRIQPRAAYGAIRDTGQRLAATVGPTVGSLYDRGQRLAAGIHPKAVVLAGKYAELAAALQSKPKPRRRSQTPRPRSQTRSPRSQTRSARIRKTPGRAPKIKVVTRR